MPWPQTLIETALGEAGIAFGIVVQPQRGPAAVMDHVSAPLARALGQPRAMLEGQDLARLRPLFTCADHWQALHGALVAQVSAEIEVAFSVDGAERWLRLHLTFPHPPEDDVPHVVLIAHDVSERRRLAHQEGSSQRLLAAIFLRIAAPVAIVRADGRIIMGNPAFQELLGYTPKELQGLRVQDLTSPADAARAQAARARQLADGSRYDMRISTLAKGGKAIRVCLTSMLLHDVDQRLRVVTLLPDPAAEATTTADAALIRRDKGELRAVSLAAFRAAFGDGWERIATRAMLKAEQIIRRRLQPEDVVNRVDDHNFVVWFDSADHERNAAVLDHAVREVRLRFLTDFGEQAASHVSATIVPANRGRPADATGKPVKPMPTSGTFEEMLRARQRRP